MDDGLSDMVAETNSLSMRPPLLTMTGVAKSFGRETVALRDLNLRVKSGDFVSLLGPSGCGKSTALRLIAGLMQPTRGSIEWGREMTRGDLGIVFQEPTLMPWASVIDNVRLPFRLRGRPWAEVRDDVLNALRLVGLEDVRNAYPRELSGGMKMRVSIARALVTKPQVILLDEPFAALDEITRFKLNDDLLALKAAIGCTVIFVTHSVFESVFLSERILVMAPQPGRIVQELHVDAPYPRDAEFRTSTAYASHTRAVSAALRDAIEART